MPHVRVRRQALNFLSAGSFAVLILASTGCDSKTKPTPENFIADGDYVAMQALGKSNTKSGGTYNNTYCQVFRLANGKVQEVTEYLDTELVTRAFGK